jgi:hypothetical protein
MGWGWWERGKVEARVWTALAPGPVINTTTILNLSSAI